MKHLTFLLSISFIISIAQAQQSNSLSKEVQIRSALLAVPADKRDSASVYGYDAGGQLVMLKQGQNEIICVADDPSHKGFSVSAYHKELQPFMNRGRELRKQGKSQDEIFKQREEEAKSGKLSLPKQPSTLYVFSAKDEDVDKNTGEVKNGYLRYVIYIPYATAKSTGLTEKPEQPGMPWIMHPGTHGAHIMINPPSGSKN
jgi:hypothetical protein